MSFLLSGTSLRRPANLDESNSTQHVQQRLLNGRVGRDYFGDNKRVWALDYNKTNPTDYTTIRGIYNAYLQSASAVTWEVTEANYTVSSTLVHVDLTKRAFTVRGDSYISDFTLVLTEA